MANFLDLSVAGVGLRGDGLEAPHRSIILVFFSVISVPRLLAQAVCRGHGSEV